MRDDQLHPTQEYGKENEPLSPQNQQMLVSVLSNALLQAVQKPPQKAEESHEVEIDIIELFFWVLSKIHYVIIAAALGTLLACSFGVITALALEHVESGKAGQEDI